MPEPEQSRRGLAPATPEEPGDGAGRSGLIDDVDRTSGDPAAGAETGPETGVETGVETGPVAGSAPLLSRLNERGFRLVMVADILAFYTIMVGTMFVRFGTDWRTYPVPTYLVSFAVAAAVFVASLYFGGLYEREPRLGAPSPLPRAGRQTLGAGGLVALLTLVTSGLARELGMSNSRLLPFPITNLVVLIILGAIAVTINRWLVHQLRTQREGPPKVVLAGDPEDLEVARSHLLSVHDRARVVAERSDPESLVDAVRQHGATDVMVVSSTWVERLYPRPVEELSQVGVPVLLRVTARETLFGLERIREVGGLPFVLLRSQTVPRSRAQFKRLFDLTVLLGLSPFAVLGVGLVALYQLIAAGRPLLYRQVRVGAAGHTFEMLKFRTMGLDAEADGGGARLAEREDPRVLRGCGWIRAARLDELPQLWNVLRGEMSIVGPRPERPELTAGFEERIPGYARRHELPPGLTGLAQIHGRYHTDAEYKLGYDLQYLVNWSPVLDLEILLRTVWVVLARRV